MEGFQAGGFGGFWRWTVLRLKVLRVESLGLKGAELKGWGCRF